MNERASFSSVKTLCEIASSLQIFMSAGMPYELRAFVSKFSRSSVDEEKTRAIAIKNIKSFAINDYTLAQVQ